MKKLLLFTDGFPYVVDERTFILPELEYLIKEYEITIVSCAGIKVKEDAGNITQ